MKESKKTKHESFGILEINKFSGGGSQFFGSDLVHNGGISITISRGEKERKLNSEWFYSGSELIRIELSNNQFVDAITSGMNTQGVPCTIRRYGNERVEQIDHVEDKREQFRVDMSETIIEYKNKIDDILKMLEGNIGKKKSEEIKFSLNVLKNHISSNTNFVMKCFDESMEKTVTEAKHSISGYIDNKVNSLGIEGLRKELKVSIENE